MKKGLRKLADELAHKYILVDGHVDLPYRLSIKNFRPTKEFIGIPVKVKKVTLIMYVQKKEDSLHHSCPFIFPLLIKKVEQKNTQMD